MPIGRFSWYDLMTTDADAVVPFYRELLGWRIETEMMGPFPVHAIHVGGRRIGSIIPEDGIPASHWMPYVAVEDVDATAARVASLGGEVCVPPTDLPIGGRFAVVADPAGAYFSVMRHPDVPASHHPGDHDFVWDELSTADPQSAAVFYRQVFGWNITLPDGSDYWHVKDGDIDFAGMTAPHGEGQPPHWLSYVAVEDAAEIAQRVPELGGTILAGPMALPNVGTIAVLRDPAGAVLALYQR